MAVAGATLVVVGAVLLVLPGPGIPLILAGLAILATEFAWARATMDRVKRHSSTAVSAVRSQLRARVSSGDRPLQN